MYQSIDDKNNACDHGKIKIEYLYLAFDLCMISQR